MTIAIYSRSLDYLSTSTLNQLLEAQKHYNVNFTFNAQYAEALEKKTGKKLSCYHTTNTLPSDTQCLISFGGDGTFLHAVTSMEQERMLPIVGVNTGRLGFLSLFTTNEIALLLEVITTKQYLVEERSMIAVKGDFPDKQRHYNAFNEFTLQKNGLNMISVDLFVSGDFVATYMADGMIVSTPTGSTAYSLSVGGPIIAPGCDCFVINPIAPHNLTMRPLVINHRSEITLKVTTRNHTCIATLDNRSFEVSSDTVFSLSLSPQKIEMIRIDPSHSFYDTLRRKLMWGVEKRKETF